MRSSFRYFIGDTFLFLLVLLYFNINHVRQHWDQVHQTEQSGNVSKQPHRLRQRQERR